MTTLQEKINDIIQAEQDFYEDIDNEKTFFLRTTTGKDALLDIRKLSMMQEIRIKYEELNDTDTIYTSPEWIRRKRRKLKLLVDEYYKDYVYLCGPR